MHNHENWLNPNYLFSANICLIPNDPNFISESLNLGFKNT